MTSMDAASPNCSRKDGWSRYQTATQSSHRTSPPSSLRSFGISCTSRTPHNRGSLAGAQAVEHDVDEAVPVAAPGADDGGQRAGDHVDVGDGAVLVERAGGPPLLDQRRDDGFELRAGLAPRLATGGPSCGLDGRGQPSVAVQHLADVAQVSGESLS